MATYTQGYQPYMPDWQPFTPDYKFLSDVLETKTNRYNTNYKALNDLYSKVVYSDLSRKDTQDMRNQFAETLGKQLEMVSGMDLSVAQNVDAAKQLFKPFYEEDLIVKDLVFTKQYQDQSYYANMLMNSPDKDQREMYWQTGVKALEYQMEDFKNASPEKALAMGTPRYTPDADLNEKAIAYLKEQGLDVTQEYVDETGFWIVKDRNGNLITQQAYVMAQKALSDDPMVQQAYYTDAYVKSRDFAKNGMDAGQFSSVDEGQAAWAKETIARVEAQIAARSIKEGEKVVELKNANINWDEYEKQSGIIPGSDEDKERQEQKRSYDAVLMGYQQTQDTLKNSQGNKDESTQGLLNRAYNLLMGYNMQTDLSAAAVAFSNINKSRELKVNDYKKQQLQYQYDLGKIAQQHANAKELEAIKQVNRIELEKEKLRINNPFLARYNELFNSGGLFNQQGTEQVLTDPETGEPLDPTTADYVKIIEGKYDTLRQDVTAEQVDLALDALEKTQSNANNYYTVNEKIKGDLPTIKRELMKPENAGIADDFYRKMATQFRDSDALMRQNPNFVKRNNGADYQDMSDRFEKVSAKRMQFDAAIAQGNQIYYDNFMKVVKTELAGAPQVRKDFERGVPQIFQNAGSGALEVKTEEEFVRDFVNAAKNKKISTGKGSGSVGWRYRDDGEAYSGMVIGGGSVAGMSGSMIASNTGRGKWGFSEQEATSYAKQAYARQKQIINATLNGSLETIAEQEGVKTDKNTRMFQPWDPYQFMRGKSLADMETGDALKNPFYVTQVDPVTAMKDPEQMQVLSDLINQVNRTPSQQLSFHKGDIGKQEDVNMNIQDPTAKKIYNLWMQDMARFRDPKTSKTNIPSVSIGYAPTYGPADQLNKEHGAYVMSFNPAWLKSLQGTKDKPGAIGLADAEAYQQITITFPQAVDMNPKKAGEYNFSATVNEVMYSPSKQVVHNINGGGKFRVYPDANNNFIGEFISLQYNPQSGNFDTLPAERVNLSQMMQERNETVGYIDNLVTNYVGTLYQIAQQNNRDQANNKKIKAKK